MKLELLVFGITAFFIANTYYDGKYITLLKSWKKYYNIAGIAFAGLSAYLFLRKYPNDARTLISSASGVMKHLPIDKEAGDLFAPILDMTKNVTQCSVENNQAESRILNSGKKSTKRCVSETKKKYVAAQQGWKCGHCKQQLSAWFEVDHKVRLEYGGSNNVDNLVALCRECHGKKTAFENF